MKRSTILWAVLFVAAAAVHVGSLNKYLLMGSDNGLYIVLAKSFLVARPMHYVNHPEEPLDDKHPFLFPLMLAPAVALFGYNFLALKAVVVACGLGALVLMWLLLKSRVEPKVLWASIATLALSPHLIAYSTQVLSDVPFIMFALGALVLIDRYARTEKGGAGLAAAAVICTLAAFYTRLVGGALIVALAAYLVIERKRIRGWSVRKCAAFLVPVAILASLFFLVNLAAGGGSGNLRVFLLRDFLHPSAGYLSAGEFVQRVFSNLIEHGRNFAQFIVGTDLLGRRLIWLAPALVTLVGLSSRFIARRSIIEYYFLAHLALMLVWVTPTARYLLPLLPLAILYFYEGARLVCTVGAAIVQRWPGKAALGVVSAALLAGMVLAQSARPEVLGRYSVTYFVVLVVAAAVIIACNVIALAGARLRRHLASVAFVALAGLVIASNAIVSREFIISKSEDQVYSRTELDYKRASEWLGNVAADDAVVVCSKPLVTYFWAGRKTAEMPLTVDAGEFVGRLDALRAVYVVSDERAGRNDSERFFAPALASRKDAFELVHVEGSARIYKYLGRALQ